MTNPLHDIGNVHLARESLYSKIFKRFNGRFNSMLLNIMKLKNLNHKHHNMSSFPKTMLLNDFNGHGISLYHYIFNRSADYQIKYIS